VLLLTTTNQHMFLHQSYLHSFDADSGLLGKNAYYLQICNKGTGLLCPHQDKNMQNHWIPVLHGIAFSIFQHDSRTTEVDELLSPGCFQKPFHKAAS